jgi:hypothetical protein
VPRFVGKETYKIFRLPKPENFVEILVSSAILIPFLLWFVEALVGWGLGLESLVISYWGPIAYLLPIHIGVVLGLTLFVIAGLTMVTKRYIAKKKEGRGV